MIRLIFLLATVIAVVIIIQQIKNTPRTQVKQHYWKLAVIALGGVLILLAVTGRIHWLGALFGALLPLIRNMLPLLMGQLPKLQKHFYKNKTTQNKTKDHTEISTRFLKVIIDNESQQLQAKVLTGPFANQPLDSLSLKQLQNLLSDCQQHDNDGYPLLVRYLNQRFGDSWWQQQTTGTSNSNDLSVAEAYQILGLLPGASKESIHSAYKKLIQKLHPDRGGNDYLAAKINRAKDILLAQVG